MMSVPRRLLEHTREAPVGIHPRYHASTARDLKRRARTE